jgi:2-methylfumaryl-CoA isomerase
MATAGNLGYLAEAQLTTPRERAGNYVYGTFGRDFETADGERLMIVTLTVRHWRDLLGATGMTDAASALATALGADFDEEDDRYRHRAVLGGLFAGWFERHTLAEAEAALRPTRVLWSTYRGFTDLAADGARLLRANPLLSELDQPGVGKHLAPGSPLVMDGRQSQPKASPRVGQHTEEILRADLGLSAAQLRELSDLGVIGTAEPIGSAEPRTTDQEQAVS